MRLVCRTNGEAHPVTRTHRQAANRLTVGQNSLNLRLELKNNLLVFPFLKLSGSLFFPANRDSSKSDHWVAHARRAALINSCPFRLLPARIAAANFPIQRKTVASSRAANPLSSSGELPHAARKLCRLDSHSGPTPLEIDSGAVKWRSQIWQVGMVISPFSNPLVDLLSQRRTGIYTSYVPTSIGSVQFFQEFFTGGGEPFNWDLV